MNNHDFMVDDLTTIDLIDLGTEQTITVTLGQDEPDSRVDMVNAPPHYHIKEGLEWIDIRLALAQKLRNEGIDMSFADFSDWDRALEYLVRAPWKHGREDVEKASFYINRLLNRLIAEGLSTYEKKD